jgi:DNA-binding NtrC family response regulator/tetratricopeptide (TPR) repeat protein
MAMDPKKSVQRIQDCEAAAARLRGAGDKRDYIEKLRQLADLYLAADGYEPAITCLDELIARGGGLGLSPKERGLLYLKKAEALRARGRPLEAMECCRQSEAELGSCKSELAYARAKMTRASVHSDLGQYAEALCRCREALPVLRKQTRQKELAELECRLGSIKARTGDVLGAREHFEQGLCLFREVEDAVGAGKAWNNLGVVFKTLCQWNRSVECFNRALESARKRGEARAVASRSCNLGVTLLKAGRWSEARAYLADALKRSTGLGSDAGVVRANIAIGMLARLERRWKVSRRHLCKALEMARASGMKREEALSFEFLGELSFDSGFPKPALKYYERALAIADETNRHVDVKVEVLRRKAEALLALGRASEALELCKEGRRLARSIPDRYEEGVLERVAGSALLENGGREEGLARLHRSHAVLRSINQSYELARTALTLGAALAESPGEGPLRAKELLLESRYLFGQVGSQHWVNQAESALVSLLGLRGEGAKRPRKSVDARASRLAQAAPSDFGLVGCGEWLKGVMSTVACFADSTLPVLVEGESGTGKDMIAKALHLSSKRTGKPYIPMNCGALPDGTQESELFGYVRGAFTGAVGERRGCFEAAHDGTLFLDEIGEMNWSTQVRLLRVLEAGEVRRIGETFPRKVDVRVIAATNGDLLRAVGQGAFRRDLYYRLAGVRIHLPPLRERRGDIQLLVSHFVGLFSRAQGKDVVVDPDLMSALVDYHWPGNVRQLRNEIERMVTLAIEKGVLTSDDFCPTYESVAVPEGGPASLADELETLEKKRIVEALRETGWNKARAAGKLGGMKRTTLLGRMKKLGIPAEPPEGKWPG